MSIKKPEDPERNQLITEVMNVDAFAEAEKLTGKHLVDIEDAASKLGLGLHLSKQALLRKLQVESGDFMFHDTWNRRKSILEASDFKQMYVEAYVLDDKPARMEIWAELTHGLVFVQNIYTGSDGVESHNDHGRVNFAFLPNPEKDKYEGLIGLQASGGWESAKYPNWRRMRSPDPTKMFFTPEDLYFRGYFEGSGMIHKLRNMLLHGKFANPWPQWEPGKYPLATWFTTSADYREQEAKGLGGFEAIAHSSARNIARYESFPEDLQRIINVKPTWRKK